MRIIIDTNVFMSGIFWSGPPAKILYAWQDEKIDLVLSTDILKEYVRVGNILSKKYNGVEINEILELLVQKTTIYNVPPLANHVCRDPDDDMFLACAIATKVKIIVSGDSDLLDIAGYQNIHVIKPRQFVDNYLMAK